jgi:hypothetical protein
MSKWVRVLADSRLRVPHTRRAAPAPASARRQVFARAQKISVTVILEFVDSQGPRTPATRPAAHICNPDGRTACVDEKPLFCTSKFCVDDLMIAPHAVRPAGGVTNDQNLVAVSGYTFREEISGTAAAVHAKKRGEIKPMAAGPTRRWTNGDDPSHLVVVTVRDSER